MTNQELFKQIKSELVRYGVNTWDFCGSPADAMAEVANDDYGLRLDDHMMCELLDAVRNQCLFN